VVEFQVHCSSLPLTAIYGIVKADTQRKALFVIPYLQGKLKSIYFSSKKASRPYFNSVNWGTKTGNKSN